ncbi:hypothetical protein C4J96_0303 [Pseudomonas orientalis]|nr:hypothetical protein C4J96_0303 [Pseudomonas orientalis]
MGWGSCFCVVQTKLPTHAGFFNNSNFLIFRKKNRGSLRIRPRLVLRQKNSDLTPFFPLMKLKAAQWTSKTDKIGIFIH